jgi:hypothetical protein
MRGFITVHPEMDLLLDDASGRVRVVPASHDERQGVAIPISLYRRHRWQGLLRRRWVRMRGYGREYFADAWYQLDVKIGLAPKEPRAGVAVDPPELKSRCGGCQKKARAAATVAPRISAR